MHAALVTGKRTIEFVEFPLPEPDTVRTVVEIQYCGICGTDLHAYLAGDPYNPAICGHEWSGQVSAAQEASGFREGDRVAVGVATACGRCATCRRGDPGHCETVFAGMVGVGPNAARHGGFAPAIAIESARLYHVDDRVRDTDAAVLEPLTVAVHAVRRTAIRLGDTVVVIGAGPIGLLVAQCARAAGAGRIAVVEPSDERRKNAAELGADVVVEPGEGLAEQLGREFASQGVDVVFECAGRAETIDLAASLVGRGGKVSLVGVPVDSSVIRGADWLVREVELTASIGYQREEFAIAQQLVIDERVRLAPLHTATFGLADIGEAFERLVDPVGDVKILIDPQHAHAPDR